MNAEPKTLTSNSFRASVIIIFVLASVFENLVNLMKFLIMLAFYFMLGNSLKDCNNGYIDFSSKCTIIPNSARVGSQNIVFLLGKSPEKITSLECTRYVLRCSIYSTAINTSWLNFGELNELFFQYQSGENNLSDTTLHFLNVSVSSQKTISIASIGTKYEENELMAMLSTTPNMAFHVEAPVYSVDNSIDIMPQNNSNNNNNNNSKKLRSFLLFSEVRRKYEGSVGGIKSELMTEINLLVFIYGFFSDQMKMFMHTGVFQLDCHPGNQLYNQVPNSTFLTYAWTDFGRSFSNKTKLYSHLPQNDMYKGAIMATFLMWDRWIGLKNMTTCQNLVTIVKAIHYSALESIDFSSENYFSSIVAAIEAYIVTLDFNIISDFQKSMGRPFVFAVNDVLGRISELNETVHELNEKDAAKTEQIHELMESVRQLNETLFAISMQLRAANKDVIRTLNGSAQLEEITIHNNI